MFSLVLAAQLALAAATPDAMEEEAYRFLARDFEKVGRNAPHRDSALDRAARMLALGALDVRASEAADAVSISRAVSAAQGFDPSPRTLVLRSAPPAQALESFRTRTDLNSEPASEAGVGFAQNGERGALVVLLADRKAILEPFPRSGLQPKQKRELCGRLQGPLEAPVVFVTRPSGTVDRLVPGSLHGRFCAPLAFTEPGRYTLEVVGTGPRGPEVVALFFTDVGTVVAPHEAAQSPEPATPKDARALILARVNALRVANGASAVTPDPALDAVAQRYGDQMAREHFFAHVSPTGQNLASRLGEAGYAYERAGENLGLAPGPLSAHFGIEHSPGHRKNLMDPAFERLGIGISTEHVNGRDQALVVQILTVPVKRSRNPLQDAYRNLGGRRSSLKLQALTRSAALESIATEQARHALALDEPHAELPGPPVHERVFAALQDARSASVDLYVTQDLAHLPDSKSLLDGSNDRVGIGAVKGDSPRYGKDRYWVVVIYAGSQPSP